MDSITSDAMFERALRSYERWCGKDPRRVVQVPSRAASRFTNRARTRFVLRNNHEVLASFTYNTSTGRITRLEPS